MRSGTYALARSELEALAGADRLDPDAVIDLAEVRWRTGDLAGAAEAAAAWLEEGESAGAPLVLAHVICAEAAADRGRAGEAEAHVEAAAAGLGDRATLDAILAGIAARAAWPWQAEAVRDAPVLEEPPAVEVAAAFAPSPVAPAAAAEVAPIEPAVVTPAAPSAPSEVPARGASVAPAAAALAQAGAALVREAPERAAVLLALALRADRAAAEAVLAALDAADAGAAAGAPEGGSTAGATHAAALAFVRAEALRAAGRHEEARIAYASAERLALAPAEAGPPGSSQ